jgi:hypothetical protein
MMTSRQQLAESASHEAGSVRGGHRPGGLAPWLSLIGLLGFGLVAAGCGQHRPGPPGKEGITARLELDDRTSSVITVTSVLALKGTYGPACLGRTIGDVWTIPLNGYTLSIDEPALTVEGGDVACTLLVDEVKVGPALAPSSYSCAAPFTLGTAYAEHGVAFLLNGAGETQFYANFRAEPDLTYLANFLVRMAYSDDLSRTDATYDTQYDISTATAVVGMVQPPDAAISLTLLDVRVTAVNVVKSATGNVLLTQGNVLGQSYAVDLGTLGTSPTYGSVDALFQAAGTPKVALAGAPQAIPATALGLTSVNLTTPQVRSIIVANTESGVTSYQIFQVTFRRPFSGTAQEPISLGAAGDFAVFAAAGVGLGDIATVFGDVGVNAGLAALTGFTPIADPGGTFSTSTSVTGSLYSTDHAAPTPAMLSTAAADMKAAYDNGMARLFPAGTDLGAGELGGLILPPGLYQWSAAATITTDLTLTGGAADVWILRVGGGLNLAANMHVHLAGGALASNVYWITVGAVTLGADTIFEGQVLSNAAITTGVNAVMNGRALSAAAVTIGASSQVNWPAP